MNEISCDMCMDLMPLVNDGVASDDSRKAVQQHISKCEQCRYFYEDKESREVSSDKVFSKLLKQIRSFSLLLLIFGIFFGLGLTAGEDMFYNSVIMPLIGVVGYMVFKWKAIYIVPLLLFAADVLMFIPQLITGAGWVDFYSLIIWTAIYCALAVLGVIISWLLHFAFRKEKK